MTDDQSIQVLLSHAAFTWYHRKLNPAWPANDEIHGLLKKACIIKSVIMFFFNWSHYSKLLCLYSGFHGHYLSMETCFLYQHFGPLNLRPSVYLLSIRLSVCPQKFVYFLYYRISYLFDRKLACWKCIKVTNLGFWNKNLIWTQDPFYVQIKVVLFCHFLERMLH